MANEVYARVLTTLPWDEKMEKVPPDKVLAAIGLYTCALVYCQTELTNGRIPRFQLSKLAPAPLEMMQDIAEVLEIATFFTADDKALEVNNYLKFNRSREEVEGIKEIRRVAGSAGGRAKSSKILANAKQTPSKPVANVYPDTDTDTKNIEQDEAFDEWYKAYPRRVGKGQAKRAYKAALKKVDGPSLLAALKTYSFNADTKYIQYPSTWLNGECWLDESTDDAAEPDFLAGKWMS